MSGLLARKHPAVDRSARLRDPQHTHPARQLLDRDGVEHGTPGGHPAIVQHHRVDKRSYGNVPI